MEESHPALVGIDGFDIIVKVNQLKSISRRKNMNSFPNFTLSLSLSLSIN
jgi:hypothetical protein